MWKKNILKALIIISVIIVILLLFHLIGGNLMNMVKNHLGI
ncbi:MAG TPA: hypothetical protein VEB00_02190 [Clostridia bacterium]|nr:hypothetical protein [Clostridia bacterium]